LVVRQPCPSYAYAPTTELPLFTCTSRCYASYTIVYALLQLSGVGAFVMFPAAFCAISELDPAIRVISFTALCTRLWSKVVAPPALVV
jgi:hypothetical protein